MLREKPAALAMAETKKEHINFFLKGIAERHVGITEQIGVDSHPVLDLDTPRPEADLRFPSSLILHPTTGALRTWQATGVAPRMNNGGCDSRVTDIVTDGDARFTQDIGGQSWTSYPPHHMDGFDTTHPKLAKVGAGGIAFPRGHILHDYLEARVMPKIVGPVGRGEMQYAEIYKAAQRLTTKPVKFGTVTPELVAFAVQDEHYKDIRERIWAISDAFNKELHDGLWEETGVGPERTVLAGFSMGTVMSYAMGLGAGLVGLVRSVPASVGPLVASVAASGSVITGPVRCGACPTRAKVTAFGSTIVSRSSAGSVRAVTPPPPMVLTAVQTVVLAPVCGWLQATPLPAMSDRLHATAK